MPDVKMMGEAIEAHVEWHKRKVKDPLKVEEEAGRLRDSLTGQVLEKASKFKKK
jgi:hypothetical protein